LIDVWNVIAEKRNYKMITTDEALELKGKPVSEIFVFSGVPKLAIPLLVSEVRELMKEKYKTVRCFEGIPEVLNEIRKQGIKTGVLTSQSIENAKNFLTNNNLGEADFIYSENNIFGKEKSLKKMLKDQELSPDEVVYVGDEIKDVKSCQNVEIKILAVSWGFNSSESLKFAGAEVMQTPEDLAVRIRSLGGF
jgi:phosphoglycolate phosphatase